MKKNNTKNLTKSQNESLSFQTMWGAKQKFSNLTPEIEVRINEELLVLTNLQLADDILQLKTTIEAFTNELSITNEPSKGILAGSVVAYCLGLEPTNPYETGAELNPLDFKRPLNLTISFDNEVRNKVVEWLKVHDYQITTYLGQPLLKLKNTRVTIRRVVKQ